MLLATVKIFLYEMCIKKNPFSLSLTFSSPGTSCKPVGFFTLKEEMVVFVIYGAVL